jgi:predicted site-specific integrase-resolvase
VTLPQEEEVYYKLATVAKMLDMSVATLRKIHYEGKIAFVKAVDSGSIRVTRTEYRRYCNETFGAK